MCGVTRRDKIRNEHIRVTTIVVQASKKITEKRLKWYGHVSRMKEEHIVRIMLDVDIPGERRRGRPTLRSARLPVRATSGPRDLRSARPPVRATSGPRDLRSTRLPVSHCEQRSTSRWRRRLFKLRFHNIARELTVLHGTVAVDGHVYCRLTRSNCPNEQRMQL